MVDSLLMAVWALFAQAVFLQTISNGKILIVLTIICAILLFHYVRDAKRKEEKLLKRIEKCEKKEIGVEHMYNFKTVNGHVEVYCNGEFICTADNMDEALKDAEAHSKGEL